MAAKLTPDLCYITGLISKGREYERSAIGIVTTMDELVEKFSEIAIKLGVAPNKILIEEDDGVKHIYFFHSKMAKQARETIERETRIFKYRNEYSGNYLAGMFDASGKVVKGTVIIKSLTSSDQLMLQTLGIHTKGSEISNVGSFIELVKDYSVVLKTKI